MNNLKTGIITCFFIGCRLLSWAQVTADASALELAKLLHKNRIEQIALSNPEAILDSTSVNLNNKEFEALYNSISQKYEQRFKPTELKELFAFYTSPIGKKLLNAYPMMVSDANTVISKWEMKQLGIEEISTIEEPVLLNEEELAFEVIDTIVPQPKLIQPKKEVIKVKTLQQLQALLKKDRDLFYDPVELSRLLNIPLESEPIDEFEPNINPEKDKKQIKN